MHLITIYWCYKYLVGKIIQWPSILPNDRLVVIRSKIRLKYRARKKIKGIKKKTTNKNLKKDDCAYELVALAI